MDLHPITHAHARRHTHTHTQATDNSEISNNVGGSDVCESFWFSPRCNNNHGGFGSNLGSSVFADAHSLTLGLQIYFYAEAWEIAAEGQRHCDSQDCSRDITLLELGDEPWSLCRIHTHTHTQEELTAQTGLCLKALVEYVSCAVLRINDRNGSMCCVMSSKFDIVYPQILDNLIQNSAWVPLTYSVV